MVGAEGGDDGGGWRGGVEGQECVWVCGWVGVFVKYHFS